MTESAQVATLTEFLRVTEANNADDLRRFRKILEQIAEDQAKQIDTYKDFCKWLVDETHHSDGAKARDFMMAWMSSKRPDLYASAVSDMLPELRRLEERDVMNVKVTVKVTEDKAQYVFGKTPLYFHDPYDM